MAKYQLVRRDQPTPVFSHAEIRALCNDPVVRRVLEKLPKSRNGYPLAVPTDEFLRRWEQERAAS